MTLLSKKSLKGIALAGCAALALFIGATAISLRPVTKSFDTIFSDSQSLRITDRNGVPLNISYQSGWNLHDHVRLYDMPEFMVKAFLFSEDRKFYDHGGVDWQARAAALWQNIRHGKTMRGASTITEQVVRMINPRPRNLWSKWLEGIESMMLEQHSNKATILEFYLNQIPYAANRQGVAQAARYYFNRDLETLSVHETLALVVLARAPSAYDLYRNPGRIDTPLQRLAGALNIKIDTELETLSPALPVEARHFARFARLHGGNGILRTTLDGSLQQQVQDILDSRTKRLKDRNVHNAGAIVIDHQNGDILAWVSAGARDAKTKGGEIDPVLTPRQPGSTLKPFLYAAALETGWNAATILNDTPIAEAVGSGLHRFRNYSNSHYGPITLREALGNSLNIPAVLTINHVGVDPFLSLLHRLGFENLTRESGFYDEGLALGNGEVSLFELTRAYAALANKGQYSEVSFLPDGNMSQAKNHGVFTEETASIIGNILSDPRARALEFGRDSVLNLPLRTAVKTGTSTDYRDAWTIGYNDRYTVGIWMGNLDRTPMKEITGSTGPALALRSIFHVLNKGRDTKPLYLSPALVERDVCTRPQAGDAPCPMRSEYFANADMVPEIEATPRTRNLEVVRPTQGLMMAYDPRIPSSHQKFRFELSGLEDGQTVEWTLNGKTLFSGESPTFLWPISKGTQNLSVKVISGQNQAKTLAPITFFVR